MIGADDPQAGGGGVDAGQQLVGGQRGPAQHGHDLVAGGQPRGNLAADHQRAGELLLLGSLGGDDDHVDVFVDDGRNLDHRAPGQAGPQAEREHLVLVDDADVDHGGVAEIDLHRSSLERRSLRLCHVIRIPPQSTLE